MWSTGAAMAGERTGGRHRDPRFWAPILACKWNSRCREANGRTPPSSAEGYRAPVTSPRSADMQPPRVVAKLWARLAAANLAGAIVVFEFFDRIAPPRDLTTQQ